MAHYCHKSSHGIWSLKESATILPPPICHSICAFPAQHHVLSSNPCCPLVHCWLVYVLLHPIVSSCNLFLLRSTGCPLHVGFLSLQGSGFPLFWRVSRGVTFFYPLNPVNGSHCCHTPWPMFPCPNYQHHHPNFSVHFNHGPDAQRLVTQFQNGIPLRPAWPIWRM